MFDLGWSEILLIVAVALIVIGPKDLPQAVRTVTQIIRRMRGMAREFQSSLDDLAREAGVDEIKRDLNEFKADYDPRAALENIADADGELSGVFDDVDGKRRGNSIAAAELDERPDPPDLTPEEFGAEAAAGDNEASTASAPDEAPVDTADGVDSRRDAGDTT